MPTYAIGDIHGCARSFFSLLETIRFDLRDDSLLLVGDLCNRGPDNVAVAEWILEHRDVVTAVIGNHDMHLLAAAGGHSRLKRKDTLEDILGWSRRDEFLDWLAHQPFLYERPGIIMVHAGIWPGWSMTEARRRARHLEEELRSPRRDAFVREMATTGGGCPLREHGEQLSVSMAVFTRMRAIHPTTLALDHRYKLGRDELGPDRIAWCDRYRPPENTKIIFGHWAALGLEDRKHYTALDSGCVWGGALSALRIDDGEIFSVPSELGAPSGS
jgi:bis(5'-nucleosyl)-tetraphosphatase (symmetrical)